jgi:hypothetical protein
MAATLSVFPSVVETQCPEKVVPITFALATLRLLPLEVL